MKGGLERGEPVPAARGGAGRQTETCVQGCRSLCAGMWVSMHRTVGTIPDEDGWALQAATLTGRAAPCLTLELSSPVQASQSPWESQSPHQDPSKGHPIATLR